MRLAHNSLLINRVVFNEQIRIKVSWFNDKNTKIRFELQKLLLVVRLTRDSLYIKIKNFDVMSVVMSYTTQQKIATLLDYMN